MRLRWVLLLAFLMCVLMATRSKAQGSDSPKQDLVTTTVTHYTLPPDKLEKAHALYTVRTTMHFGETIYGIVLLVLILRFGINGKFRDLAERMSGNRFLQACIFVPLLTIVLDGLGLPFGIYSHSLSLKYGLSVQKWGSWFWDWTKGELIGIVVGALLVAVLYWLIRVSPARWWFYAWLLCLPFLVLVIWAVPVVLDPLFNKFEPLAKDHQDLVEATQKVAKAAGVEITPDRMFLMKASEKVTTANAYVTGLGSTKRVVIWDTTPRQMTTPQTTFVIAHEMGHYVLNHIYKGLAFAAVLMFFGFYIVYRTMNWFVARWGASTDIRAVWDWASLPALMLVASLIGFATEPIASTFSRTQIEHKADEYGLKITSQITPDYRQVAAQGFQSLGEHSLSYPYPSRLMVVWLYDHPDVSSRVDYALQYEPGKE
ncbi:peptidase M48, Ste24p [Candidatus Koribacter versatilis Ellin345]|uniref:Peptidase M48, Ste24p n=1 Tax=Koribacter versatilis (strain Ellin345) TaxID=204669 RepID=Q1IIX1_KORVE|nr:M48 family metallopeptidase [Candidatus Koribacter versatilis]ABF43179.1 peptidase M48, Ste24p [Candidatus Koribacter versatilis Ellin345]